MDNIKLCAFSIAEKGEFIIYGAYEIAESTDIYSRPYKYPDFYNLTAKMVVGSALEDYLPDGVTWSGRRYDVGDMITDCIANKLRNTKLYEITYMEPGLTELLNSYLLPTEISTTVNGNDIPCRILNGSMLNLYTLELVTNEYIYYFHGDEFLMIGTESREVISDNYFASIGYNDSVDAIRDGTEELIWGKLPEEIE